MKPNVLFLLDCPFRPNSGGLERVTEVVKNGLSKLGYHTIIASALPENLIISHKEEMQQCEILHWDLEEKEREEEYRNFLEREKIDLIIFQDVNAPLRWYMSKTPEEIVRFSVLHMQPYSLLGRERYVKQHTPWRHLYLKGKFFKALGIGFPYIFRKLYIKNTTQIYSNALDNIDRLILLSEKYEPRIKKHLNKKYHSKIVSIINPNTFIISQQAKEEERENIVLWVGRMYDTQKNATGFIDVWKFFSQNHPDWKAIMLGNGTHMDVIQEFARKREVKNLEFGGNVKNIEDYYRKSKILCMTSIYEGWPMTLNEAMSYGCVPVLFKSYEASEEIIDHEENGLLVRPFDLKLMSRSLDRLVENEELRRRLSKNAVKKASNFNINNIINNWDDLINKMGNKY